MTYAQIIERHPELTHCHSDEVLALMAYLAGGIDALDDVWQAQQELAAREEIKAANES